MKCIDSRVVFVSGLILFSSWAKADGFLDCVNAVGPDRLNIAVTALDSAVDFLDNGECNALYASPWFDGICGGIAGGMVAANIAKSENACMALPTEPAGQFLVTLANKVPGPWTGALTGSIQQEQAELANLIPGYACVCKFVGLADDASRIVSETEKLGDDASDCAQWLEGVFGPAGQLAAQVLQQGEQDLQNAYNTVVNAFNSMGCSLMGNCGSSSPPPTHDEYYAKYYSGYENGYAFADATTINLVLSAQRSSCVKFWNFWDAAENDGFDPGAVIQAATAGENGPGAKTCNSFEAKFRADTGKIKDTAVAEGQREDQTVGEDFAILLNDLYLGQCKDQQCRTGVYFLSIAVVGEFKQVGQRYGNNPNNPAYQAAIRQAKYDIPKEYKPKYQVLITECNQRVAAQAAKDRAIAAANSAEMDRALAQTSSVIAKYKLDVKSVVLHLRDPRKNPAPVVVKLRTRPPRKP